MARNGRLGQSGSEAGRLVGIAWKYTRLALIPALLLFAWPSTANAACTGSSPAWTCASWTDLETLLEGASLVNDDTVTLSDGSYTATSTITLTKRAHVTANACTTGVDGAGNSTPTSCPVVITNNVGSGQSVFDFTLPAPSGSNILTRFSNLQFNAGTGTCLFGVFGVHGSKQDNRRFRIDHVYINDTDANGACPFLYAWEAVGVADHVRVEGSNPALIAQVNGSDPNGATDVYGDYSWSLASPWATDSAVYFESSTFIRSTQSHTCIDSHRGGNYVVRYSAAENCTYDGHGAEGSRRRSTRSTHIYRNILVHSNAASSLQTYIRGGVTMMHDNAIYTAGSAPQLSLLNFRALDTQGPFGAVDGRNPWDVNGTQAEYTETASSSTATSVDSAGTPWMGLDLTKKIIRKTGGSAKTCTALTDNGATATATCAGHGFANGNTVTIYGTGLASGALMAWSQNYTISNVATDTFDFAFADYTPANVSSGQILATVGMSSAVITSNDNNTITYQPSAYGGTYTLTFTAGDTFEINNITHIFDGTGRTLGSTLSGATPSLPVGWNDQTTETSAEWNNDDCPSNPPALDCASAADADFSGGGYPIFDGTHYYTDETQPTHTDFTYPHPLVTCGQVTCDGGGAPRSFRFRRAELIPFTIVPFFALVSLARKPRKRA
jgi:hypothetical protein